MELLAGEEVAEEGDKVAEALGRALPHDRVIDRGVAVDQHVAKGDDARQVVDAICCAGIGATEAVLCLADDFELALDRRPQHRVVQVVAPGPPGDERPDQLRRPLRVPQKCR